MLQTINFNGSRQINASGRFFRYEYGVAGGLDPSIRVRADGQDLGTYLPGEAVRIPKDASLWEITPINPSCYGAIRVGIGEVESSRLSGSVEVLDAIGATVQTVGAGASSLALTAGRADTIIAPATNVNGLIVRQMTLAVTAAVTGTADARFVAAPTAPTGYNGNLMPLQAIASANGGAQLVNSSDLKKRIPPGWGIFLFYSIQTNPAQLISYSLSTELI